MFLGPGLCVEAEDLAELGRAHIGSSIGVGSGAACISRISPRSLNSPSRLISIGSGSGISALMCHVIQLRPATDHTMGPSARPLWRTWEGARWSRETTPSRSTWGSCLTRSSSRRTWSSSRPSMIRRARSLMSSVGLSLARRPAAYALPTAWTPSGQTVFAAAWMALSVKKRVSSDSSARSANCSGVSPVVPQQIAASVDPALFVAGDRTDDRLEADGHERGRGIGDCSASRAAHRKACHASDRAGERGHGQTRCRRFFRLVLVLLAVFGQGRVVGHGHQHAALPPGKGA